MWMSRAGGRRVGISCEVGSWSKVSGAEWRAALLLRSDGVWIWFSGGEWRRIGSLDLDSGKWKLGL